MLSAAVLSDDRREERCSCSRSCTQLDHKKLDVYRVSIPFVTWAFVLRLVRIVSMLSRMADGGNEVGEEPAAYGGYKHEHRSAEHEHEEDGKPRRCRAGDDG